MQLPSCQYHNVELEGYSLMGSQLDKSLTFFTTKISPIKTKESEVAFAGTDLNRTKCQDAGRVNHLTL